MMRGCSGRPKVTSRHREKDLEGCRLKVGGSTLEARFSTRATMEFLKSVPAVRGRLVTSVMSCCPSGHMARRVGSVLWTQAACPDAGGRMAPTPARPCVNFMTLGCEGQTECLKALPARVPGPLPSSSHTRAQRGPSPVVQQPLEVLEEEVSVLINEALHRVPGGGPREGQ